MATHRPHGLKRLHVVADPKAPGKFEIFATASPDKFLGGFEVDRRMQVSDVKFNYGTIATAHLNGTLLGTGKATKPDADWRGHAEQWLAADLTSRIMELAARGVLHRGEDNQLVIRITRSPCEHCTSRLIRLAEQMEEVGFPTTMTIEAASLYKAGTAEGAQSYINLVVLRQNGIKVEAWDIIEHAEEVFGPDVDQEELRARAAVIETRVNELAFALRDFGLLDVT